MSIAVETRASLTSAGFSVGLPDRIRPAIAAAFGAAADVPKNGAKPGTDVVTPSAAVRSGFCRVSAKGVPSGAKNVLRGPSEVKRSGFCVLL